jgi:Tfp pilus assembly protein PilO
MTVIATRSYRILTWLLPALVALSAYSWLEKEAGEIVSRVSAMGAVSAKIRKTGIHIRELPEMKTDYEKLVRKKAAIASSLFGAQSEAGLYELLLQKAREADVSIIAMAPRPQRTASGFTELPLSLEVAGGFDDIARFTGLVENVNRLMRVEELALSKDRDGRVVAAIRLLVYMYSDTSSLPPASKSKLDAAFQKRETYLAELENVLQVKISPPSYAFTPSGRSDPFGMTAGREKTNSGAANQADTSKQTLGMTLKGILWKEPPLAILETLDGRTFIVKKGETVSGFTISSIERGKVTVSSPRGTHVLHQYADK